MSCDDDACVATFAPTDTAFAFHYSSSITVTLQGGTRDDGAVESTRATSRGGQLSTTTSFTFDVEDPDPLRVVSLVPGTGSSNVDRYATLVATFSEPPQCAMLNAAASVVETLDAHPRFGIDADTDIPVDGEWTCPTAAYDPAVRDSDMTCDSDACVATFVPTVAVDADHTVFAFHYSSLVTITLDGGVFADTPVESLRATTKDGQLPETVVTTFDMVNPPDLRLLGVSPAPGSVNVALGATLTATFSEPPDCVSLNALSSVVESIDAHPRFAALAGTDVAVPGSWTCPAAAYDPAIRDNEASCDAGACVATFIPTDGAFVFQYSSTVTITLNGGIYTDGAVESLRATTLGGQIPDTLIMPFGVEHPPALLLTASVPQNGTVGAALSTTVEVTFSEGVRCASFVDDTTFVLSEELDPHLHYGDGTGNIVAHSTTATCTDGVASVVFDSPVDFQHSSLLTLTLSGGAFPDALESDRATTQGGQLSADVTIDFRAEDPPALLVAGASPAGASDGIALDYALAITFSEAVDCTNTIDAAAFTVVETPIDAPSTPINHSCTFTCDDTSNVVICDTAADFGHSSVVEVTLAETIESAISSSISGTLAADFVFSFATSNPPPLLVASVLPGEGSDNVTPDSLITITFSEGVDCDTVNGTTLTVEAHDPVAPTVYASVAGTIACTTGDPVVTFDADPTDYDWDAEVHLHLSTAIQSARATTLGGQLAQTLDLYFDIVPVPPIEVVSTDPADEETNIVVESLITVVFSQPVADGSFCPADTELTDLGGTSTGRCESEPNVWIWLEGETDINNRVPLVLKSYDQNTYTAVFKTVVDSSVATPVDQNLTAGKHYEVVIRGDGVGITNQGAANMIGTYRWQFLAGVSAYIESVTPSSGAVGVPVTAEICGNFFNDVVASTVDENSFIIDYVDCFGRPVFLTVDTSTYTTNGTQTCFDFVPTDFDCVEGQRTLLYDTTYTVMLKKTIESGLLSSPMADDFSWDFTTGSAPAVVHFSAENGISAVSSLDMATEVPVNSAILVDFSEAMDPALVDETHFVLEDSTLASVVTTVTLSDDGMQARIEPAALLFNETYTLVVFAGMNSALNLDSEWLDVTEAISFTTSPETLISFSPPDSFNALELAGIVAVFSRPMHLPSLTNKSFYAHNDKVGEMIATQVALDAADVDSAMLTPFPAFAPGNPMTISITPDAMDYLGNPMRVTHSITYADTESAPAANSLNPDQIKVSAITPVMQEYDSTPATVAIVDGDQEFLLELPSNPATGKQDQRMVPATFNSDTIIIEDVDGCNGPAGEIIGQTNDYFIEEYIDSHSDGLHFRAAEYIQSGCLYLVTMRVSKYTNLLTLATSSAEPDFVFAITGEANAPDDLDITTDFVPADGASITAETEFAITFSEAVDPESVDSTTVILKPLVGAALDVTYRVEGSTVYVTPVSAMDEDTMITSHSLKVTTGVTDLAGNALPQDKTASYTVTGPSVVTVDTPATPADPIVITFDEVIDPTTVTGDTLGSDGSIMLRDDTDNSIKIYGCIFWSEDGKTLTFTPAAGLVASGVSYDLTLTTAIADRAGNALNSHNETIAIP